MALPEVMLPPSVAPRWHHAASHGAWLADREACVVIWKSTDTSTRVYNPPPPCVTLRLHAHSAFSFLTPTPQQGTRRWPPFRWASCTPL